MGNDKRSPCLVDVATGKIVETHVAKIDRFALKRYTQRNGWGVDWHEYSKSCEVFGVYVNEDDEPQGLIALEYKRGATYVGFAQAAPQNDKHALDGQPKRYEGVGGHLFALAVEQSSKNGGDGAVFGYAANARLLKHYCEKLGAQHLPIYHEYQFIIEDDASRKLLEKYTYERK